MGMCEPASEIVAEALDDGERARWSGHGLDDLELSYDAVDHRFNMNEFLDRDLAVNGLGLGSCPTASLPEVLLLSWSFLRCDAASPPVSLRTLPDHVRPSKLGRAGDESRLRLSSGEDELL